MKGIILIGGGGHCASVLDSIKALKIYDVIEIADTDARIGSYVGGRRISHKDEDLLSLFNSGIEDAIITVGSIKDTSLRRRLYMTAKEVGFSFPAIVDKTAVVAADAVIGQGVFIGKNAVVNTGAVVKDMAIINTAAVIEHNCYVGEFSHVAVGAVLCGDVKVGSDSFIGANATVVQNISIGNRCIIGAGNVVKRNIGDETTLLG